METEDIPTNSASSLASSSSPAPAITPVIPTRKSRKAEEKVRQDNIAADKLKMVNKAIKASAVHTRIADENASRNSERAQNRKRLADAQIVHGDLTQDATIAAMASSAGFSCG